MLILGVWDRRLKTDEDRCCCFFKNDDDDDDDGAGDAEERLRFRFGDEKLCVIEVEINVDLEPVDRRDGPVLIEDDRICVLSR